MILEIRYRYYTWRASKAHQRWDWSLAFYYETKANKLLK